MTRHRWNILGRCEMTGKKFGKTTTEEGHKVFLSTTGKGDKNEHDVGYFVHKDIVNTAMGCRPVSSRLIAICLRAVPCNITIVQAYSPTSGYTNNKIENSMTSYRMSLIRHRRRTFLLCKETGMQKWARVPVRTGKSLVDPFAMTTQMREDSDFWSLPNLTILRWRTLLVITKHPKDGPGIAQMDHTATRLITF